MSEKNPIRNDRWDAGPPRWITISNMNNRRIIRVTLDRDGAEETIWESALPFEEGLVSHSRNLGSFLHAAEQHGQQLEREECAKLCDEDARIHRENADPDTTWAALAESLAQKIRARAYMPLRNEK